MTHQCDYTIVGSPRVLELVLKVCSGRKMDEEEVGEANTFTKICFPVGIAMREWDLVYGRKGPSPLVHR